MSQLTTAQSCQLIQKIAEHLNTIIALTGSIKPNNRELWRGVLHELDNHHWQGMTLTLMKLQQQQPHIGALKHSIALEECQNILTKYGHKYDRIMDQKNYRFNHKPIAWKCLMTIRELYNAACDIDLPNNDSSKEVNRLKELIDG